MKKPILLIMLALALAAGCGPSKAELQRQAFHADLDKAMGTKTYDDCIQRWGPPTSRVEGEQVFVCVWETASSEYRAMPVFGMLVARQVNHGVRLQLTFDKLTNKLIAWHHQEW